MTYRVHLPNAMTFNPDEFVQVKTPEGSVLALKVVSVNDKRVRLQSGLSFNARKSLKIKPSGAYIITPLTVES